MATAAFGEKMKEQVEERLRFYDDGIAPKKNITAMQVTQASGAFTISRMGEQIFFHLLHSVIRQCTVGCGFLLQRHRSHQHDCNAAFVPAVFFQFSSTSAQTTALVMFQPCRIEKIHKPPLLLWSSMLSV